MSEQPPACSSAFLQCVFVLGVYLPSSISPEMISSRGISAEDMCVGL